ncbi:Rpn family recombination-promoting nuclease/putative transposase [Nostoc sp.]|uniref:Rpn family recombination-promoting nuclease/putative transposase n=1 Tax=Nostoc sp. TaxID=1180 RepID=UPI002FFCA07E
MFDNICKFLAENFSTDFATWLLGEPISLTELSPSELSLEPIRADALILLESAEIVLHLEFQTQPDANIPFRMIDYRLRVYRRFPQKQMRQVVIYLKETSSELVQQNTFTIAGTRHEFEVLRLWEQPTEVFLHYPGLFPFAVLGRTDDRASTLQQVAQEIIRIPDQRLQNNVAAATAILAGLVLEKGLIQRVLRRDNMRESVIYQEIEAEAQAKGIAQGIAQGRAEGLQEGIRQVAVNLLKSQMPLEQVAKLTGLLIEDVQLLQTELEGEST